MAPSKKSPGSSEHAALDSRLTVKGVSHKFGNPPWVVFVWFSFQAIQKAVDGLARLRCGFDFSLRRITRRGPRFRVVPEAPSPVRAIKCMLQVPYLVHF